MNSYGNRPFLLRPAGKDYLWGGRRLKDDFSKEIEMEPLAETWECSTHPDGLSICASGPNEGRMLIDILREHPEYIGSHPSVQPDGGIPVLVKLIRRENIILPQRQKQTGSESSCVFQEFCGRKRSENSIFHTMRKID